jgi:hypothetical protein
MNFNSVTLSSLFAVFFVAACSAGSTAIGVPGPSAAPDGGDAGATPTEVHDDLVVFTSKASFDGNLGGLAGADEKCNTYAKAAGLAGTFRAWLSDSKTDAISRVPDGGPWRVLDRSGKQSAIAFQNRDGWTGYPQTKLYPTEFGKSIGDDSPGSTTSIPYTWTGTKLGGKKLGCACEDWTSSKNFVSCADSFGGAIGSREAPLSDEDWTYITDNPCDAPASLLCFQLP